MAGLIRPPMRGALSAVTTWILSGSLTDRHRHPAGIDNCRRAHHAWNIQAMSSATGKFRSPIFILEMKNSA
jgi:hypothetical protein